ncbi:MFS transporter, partial [Streptomyces zhihengii]
MPSTSVDQLPQPAATPPAPPAGGRRAHPWPTLLAVSFGVFMVQPDASVMAMANPEIGRSLRASTADLPWVTGSRQPALAASLIPGGRLGDRFGRRTYHLVGVAGFTLVSVATGPAGSVEGVTAGRARVSG